MNISFDLATNILNKMKEIIKQDLNYINTSGFIIASTDLTRIGNFHEASLICIKQKKTLVINYDNEFIGTKKGINIPVYFNNKIIGVIGITGDKEEVEKYGEIIKMMTEILIKEAWLKDSNIKLKELKRNFIENIILGHNNNFFPQFKLLFPCIIVVGKLNRDFTFSDKEIYNLLDSYFSNKESDFYTISRNEIIIITHYNKNEYVSEKINALQKYIFETINLDCKFGISPISFDNSTLKDSYKAAKEAIKFIENFSFKKRVYEYEKMDLEFILLNLKNTNIKKFTDKILKSFSEKEIEEFSRLIIAYEDNNGSIYKTANELFMHKNTLQYKLNKISSISGYDPRNLRDFVILTLAFKLSNKYME